MEWGGLEGRKRHDRTGKAKSWQDRTCQAGEDMTMTLSRIWQTKVDTFMQCKRLHERACPTGAVSDASHDKKAVNHIIHV